jgi:hypothetical protein
MADGRIFTFAGDEAGDVGFEFGRGASRFFVVAVIATQDPDTLRNCLADLRDEAHLPPNFDFHFNSLASPKLRAMVFSALSRADFEAWAIVADKTSLSDAFKLMTGLDVYLYFVSELIRLIPPQKREGGFMILDEFGDPEGTKAELKRVMKARAIDHGFRRIAVRRSQSESLIQVADLVAGSILRRDAHKQSAAFAEISGKVREVIEYRG